MSYCLVIHLRLIHFFKPNAIEGLTVLKTWYQTHNNACSHYLDIKAQLTTHDILN